MCARAVAALVERASASYVREDILPRLLPDSRRAVGDSGWRYTKKLCSRLAVAIRRERSHGRAGHWSYDLNRHLALVAAYRAERARLGRERASSAPAGGAERAPRDRGRVP